MIFSRQKKEDYDYILGSKIKMMQPKDKYCISIDAVFLGAAVKENKSATLLDIGFGTGAVSFVALNNNPKLKITGLEIQDEMIALAKQNIKLNQFKGIKIVKGDLKHNPIKEDFDYVVTNPPYFVGTKSPNHIKNLAHQEFNTSLKEWCEFCCKRVKNHGTFIIVHMPERLAEILAVLVEKKMGKIEVFPLASFEGEKANRIIVRAVKGSKTPTTLYSPLVVHQKTKKYTAEAGKILTGSFLEDFFS